VNDEITRTANLIAAALLHNERLKEAKPEDNPLNEHTMGDLIKGKGVRMSADNRPAVHMPSFAAPRNSEIRPLNREWYEDDPEGATLDYLRQWTNQRSQQIEVARQVGLRYGREDKANRRRKAQRARVERKKQYDAIAKKPVQPNQVRLAAAWTVATPLMPIVERITRSKRSWAERYLGTIMDDMPSIVMENIVLVLAKSDHNLVDLAVAAAQLGGQAARSSSIPGEQVSDEEKGKRRKDARNRKWLMGMVNNRVMGALTDAYMEKNNLRWDNLDMIDTVMTSLSGVGDDPLVSRHKADRAPAMLGTTFPRPGEVDRGLLSAIINGAIAGHGLDALVELMLDEDCRQTDGSFRWTENAQRVFYCTPDGKEKWDVVVRATAHLKRPDVARADAARLYVRQLFEWLPTLIIEAVRAFDYHVKERIITVDGHVFSVVRNDLDDFLQERPSHLLVPRLDYASPEEAALVIAEHLATYTTGDDLVRSIVFA
jgi:hypothetical protein